MSFYDELPPQFYEPESPIDAAEGGVEGLSGTAHPPNRSRCATGPLSPSPAATATGGELMGAGEIWRSVADYEGAYSISSRARMRSEARVVIRNGGMPYTVRERILKQSRQARGGMSVTLCRQGIRKSRYVTCLFEVAFGRRLTAGDVLGRSRPE